MSLLNEVTFLLKEDHRGRFVVDVKHSRDGGKPVVAGYYASFETVEEAIESGLRISGKYLKPSEYAADSLFGDDEEEGNPDIRAYIANYGKEQSDGSKAEPKETERDGSYDEILL